MARDMRNLLHTRELYRQLIEAYDKLGDECVIVGDDKGQAEWIRKGMDMQAKMEEIDTQINDIWMRERL